eukprot:732675-Amorphochlora_amoeboformis.AAC.1
MAIATLAEVYNNPKVFQILEREKKKTTRGVVGDRKKEGERKRRGRQKGIEGEGDQVRTIITEIEGEGSTWRMRTDRDRNRGGRDENDGLRERGNDVEIRR